MKNRKHLRVPVPVPVRLKMENKDNYEDTTVRDISWGGVLIKLDQQPTVGARLLIQFDIPDQPVTVEIWGKVVRVNNDNQGKVDGVGVEFDELDHETRSQIQGLVNSLITAQFQKK
jgi:uncharacterized protein (TIGR02266 family)